MELSYLLHVAPSQLVVQAWEITYFDALWPHKDAMFGFAVEVPRRFACRFVGDAAVVLAGRFIERNADPRSCAAGNLRDCTYVQNCTTARIRAAG